MPSMGGMDQIRQIAVRKFFQASFEMDLYPDEATEKIFGVRMDNGIGSLVFNSWKTLFLRAKIDEDSVRRALQQGRLPQFFEETVRGLGATEHSYYTTRLTGGDVDTGFEDNLPRPGRALFNDIPWDQRLLTGLARP